MSANEETDNQSHNPTDVVKIWIMNLAVLFLVGVCGFFITKWIASVDKKAEANESTINQYKSFNDIERNTIKERVVRLETKLDNLTEMSKEGNQKLDYLIGLRLGDDTKGKNNG